MQELRIYFVFTNVYTFVSTDSATLVNTPMKNGLVFVKGFTPGIFKTLSNI